VIRLSEADRGDGLKVTFYEPAPFGRGGVDEEALRGYGLPTGGVLVVLDARAGARGGAGDVRTLARVLGPRLVIFQRSVTEAAFAGQSAAHAALIEEGARVLATEGEGTLRVEVEDGRLVVRRWKEDDWRPAE
jgi:hypothetical protein